MTIGLLNVPKESSAAEMVTSLTGSTSVAPATPVPAERNATKARAVSNFFIWISPPLQVYSMTDKK
ncbi:hypothetical protein BBEV_0307 [Salisediminibacterium beveridgei]|uniref:Uncharacterized protein n=1 Tax=Salisediminibacterium beveridgei TaxID=632773 RepID=A0A1D7QRT5_9BACI|nr:hypothetical protein BBEV_0307 [Salisediminibacterium beveridgei]